MSLHNTQKLDDDLGRRADQDLPLAAPFSVDDVVLLWGLLTTRGRPKPEMDEQGSHSARVYVRSGERTNAERQTKTDTRTMSNQGSRGGRWAVREGAVSIWGAQPECRAMESASQDWDFDQRASDCASPIAR
jgi:hypothetical protein